MKRTIISSKSRLRIIIMLLLISSLEYARAAKLDPESKIFYQMARHFMTKDEARVFNRLATSELRHDFIRAFWEIRDPDPLTEENEFRDEIEKRFEFINGHFREASREGWNTVRGMIYLVLGPPNNQVESSAISNPISGNIGFIRWFYFDLGFYVQFIDRHGFGTYELDIVNTPLSLMDYLELAKKYQLNSSEKGIAKRFLKFIITADTKHDRLTVSVAMHDLAFELAPGDQKFARLHVAFNLYLADGTIVNKSDEQRLSVSTKELNDDYLHFNMAVPLQKGRNRIDILVTDQIGGKTNRQFFLLKKK